MTHKKENFNDGICEVCGNTGLAGDTCSECGSTMVSTGDVKEFEVKEDETGAYPPDLVKDEEDGVDTIPLEEADEEIKEKIDD